VKIKREGGRFWDHREEKNKERELGLLPKINENSEN